MAEIVARGCVPLHADESCERCETERRGLFLSLWRHTVCRCGARAPPGGGAQWPMGKSMCLSGVSASLGLLYAAVSEVNQFSVFFFEGLLVARPNLALIVFAVWANSSLTGL